MLKPSLGENRLTIPINPVWRKAVAPVWRCGGVQLRTPTHAFTLVELLVVMGIVALLVGLLLPALGSSKARARGIYCLASLRQMGIAAHCYIDAFNGYYPPAYGSETRNGMNYACAWDLTTIMGTTPSVVPGWLWQGHGSRQIQQCPSFKGGANWLADPYTGYNYNTSYIGHGQFEAIPEPAKGWAVRHPAATALFGDGEYSAGANKFMRAPWPNPGDETFKGRWAGTQGFRHQGRSNVSFCDGHAEPRRERFTQNKDGASQVAPGTGFLSADNALYDLE